jgi:hypothetical protein
VISSVHGEGTGDEDKYAVGDGARLNILVVDLVVDSLEAKGFDFFGDLLAADEGITSIGHGAVVKVEVDEPHAVLHDGGVVLNDELVSDGLDVHCWRKLFEIINQGCREVLKGLQLVLLTFQKLPINPSVRQPQEGSTR